MLNIQITDKQHFINCCNEIGLLIIDISPFALNPHNTIINYRNISKSQYYELVKGTLPLFFEQKLKAVCTKKWGNIKVFFRYARVKKQFQDLISDSLTGHNFIASANEIGDISKRGGGIDKAKLYDVITWY